MWNWTDHRRKKILETPFPADWENILERNIAHFQRLNAEERRHLRDLIQVFVAEKNWEGCGGLEMTDEIRVTIAAGACLIVLALPHDLYTGVESILVYLTTVVTPSHEAGVFERPRGILPLPAAILGQAELHGPVILVWDSALHSAKHPEGGHNVVYHEFAHKLDMFDGHADGTPPLDTRAQYEEWTKIFSREFLRLRELASAGKRSFLDSYGAVNEAEFFAVVTEQFFDQPVEMKKHHPELYGVVSGFYRQDPASRAVT